MMLEEYCGYHWYRKTSKLFRRLCAVFLCFVILVLLAILVIWLVLRPTKPKFYLRDATVNQFNLSDTNYLTSIFQVTVTSRNPNDRIGIYYDRLDLFANYKGQQITAATRLPPDYQGHNGENVWPPYINGTAVPLAPYLAVAVRQEVTAGLMLIYIKIEGKLRWKVATWVSGHYHINVNCPAFLTVDSGKEFHFQSITSCSVDI